MNKPSNRSENQEDSTSGPSLSGTRKKVTMKEDWTQKEEWLQQDNLIYAGLIGIGVVLMPPFIAAASLDLPSKICVVAFSLAIPLLAVLVMLTQVQSLHHYATYPGYLVIAKTVGQVSAFVGVVAAFWHVLWIAGVVVLVSGIAGLGLYATYYKRLERDQGIKSR
jgi:hypothetical protein